MGEWLIEAIPFLEKSDYEQLVNFYEEIIENNTEDINNYWYLGLAYLFEGREEEAKTIWFMPFLESKENEEELQQSLIDILSKEADYQNTINNHELTWLIRQEIKEIEPNNIQNLLYLLKLSFQLNKFNNSYIFEWNLIELITNSQKEDIDFNLIYEILATLLEYSLLENIPFTEAVLINQEGNAKIINLVIAKAHYMAYEQNYFLYGADLGKLCLKYYPQNLYFLKEIFWYYILAKEYDKSREIANDFFKYATTQAQKIMGSYHILTSILTKGDWFNVREISEQHQNLLAQIPDNPEDIPEHYIRDSLILVTQFLLYVKDEPREKRPVMNKVSALFQKIIQSDYSCPVHFPLAINYSQPRKLKIGYIGSTLRRHSVGWLSRWLMAYHNKETFSVYAYFINQQEDDITKKWFINNVDKSINFQKDINAIVTQIEEDEIDILVDLDSFTLNVTAIIMALKPAPIQVSWLGMDTTGIPAIDYFIADPYVLPEDAQEYYQEKIWRLPDTYLGVDGFEVDVPNISRENLEIPSDAIVYLNIQNALKRHPDIIHLQMRIIKSVPNSYLLIKGNGDQETLKKQFLGIAEEEGVEENKLRFLDRTTTETIHRANLEIADVVLDTYPYNGATTTLETLWMEVPLVTRVGEQFAARNSYTFMINAGITEGIAWTDEEYVEWGIKLGKDENLRKEISWKLRQSKKTSPLWNGKKFTKEMEKAYRQMWEIYINQNQE